MPTKSPIYVHDSESESEHQPAAKRQKISASSSTMSEEAFVKRHCKASTLKGRKRFNADLDALKAEVNGKSLTLHGFYVKDINNGDDEGAVELSLHAPSGSKLALTLLVSDTSEYPRQHTFFAYASETPDDLTGVDESISAINDLGSKPIAHVIERVCLMLTAGGGTILADIDMGSDNASDDEEEEEEDEDYEPYDAFDDIKSSSHASGLGAKVLERLQRDFLLTLGQEYKPGLISLSNAGNITLDSFCISVSVPVLTLVQSGMIPAQALIAWDRRLLSKKQHFTLLIAGEGLPSWYTTGGLNPAVGKTTWKVGLSGRSKPGREQAKEAIRSFGLVNGNDVTEEAPPEPVAYPDEDDFSYETPAKALEEEEVEPDERFNAFALSSSLQSLMQDSFFKLVRYRRQYKLGWAGAEALNSLIEKQQLTEDVALKQGKAEIAHADKEERKLAKDALSHNQLPPDPILTLGKDEEINLPLTAFCYVLRRFSLCTRFCTVCHNKLDLGTVGSDVKVEALKPGVCSEKLCQYRYYAVDRADGVVGVEYDILHNPETVDLLVSLTYTAAAEGVLGEMPVGANMRFVLPNSTQVARPIVHRGGIQIPAVSVIPAAPPIGNDGLVEFDRMDDAQRRASIQMLIEMLPSVDDMRKHLTRKVKSGQTKPKLKEIPLDYGPLASSNPAVQQNAGKAVWTVLRWIIGSCTAYLEEIASEEAKIRNLDTTSWRLFRFSVGAPDAEAKFQKAVAFAKGQNANAKAYPTLLAFHGSPLRNWHSIIRNGLWFKEVANGRAYGDGVYLAKDAETSMQTYAAASHRGWPKSAIGPTAAVALAEIVNLPDHFVSKAPHFVIKETEWIVCRYLLVRAAPRVDNADISLAEALAKAPTSVVQVPLMRLDPTNHATMKQAKLAVPDPSYQLTKLVRERTREFDESMGEEQDEEDNLVFTYVQEIIEIDDEEDDIEMLDTSPAAGPSSGATKRPEGPPADDWKHDEEYVRQAIEHVMPPPQDADRGAAAAVQRELKHMLSEQANAAKSKGGLKELGWYMNEELISDNIFQWVVEIHSFEEDLPIAKDMKANGVNSLIFEVRFPPNFPSNPPFFRIITPRFLPFIRGGGGHVTGGGSICMDLLTSDGWRPIYSIPAVLMQIKMAISNLDPRPARLWLEQGQWKNKYGVHEALEGFKRAAATHGWTVPKGTETLLR